LWLTLLTSVPHSLWRHRHLWHHAGEPQSRTAMPWTPQALAEFALVGLLVAGLALLVPRAFVLAWLPGFGLGMALCQLQGWAEHALPERQIAAGGISFYAPWYNTLWFNDGFHAEHHTLPAVHWTSLPGNVAPGAAISELPPVLRWLPHARAQFLAALENLALASPLLQRFMVRTHTRAVDRLLRAANLRPSSVVIVGGGIFPRSVLVLRDLLPDAHCTIVDADAANTEQARTWLADHGIDPKTVAFRVKWFDGACDGQVDLVILPLAVLGDLRGLRRGVRGHVLNHAWLWQPGRAQEGCVASVVVSPWLLKRTNLYRPLGD
jgi:hypothetical protein